MYHKEIWARQMLSAALSAALVLCILAPPAARAQSISQVKQVAAFSKWDNALALSEEIMQSGKKAFIMEKKVKGKTFFAVLVSTGGTGPAYTVIEDSAWSATDNPETGTTGAIMPEISTMPSSGAVYTTGSTIRTWKKKNKLSGPGSQK